MRLSALVTLAVLLAAILPSSLGAAQPVATVQGIAAGAISVSFTGGYTDVFRRAFKIEADARGQLVELKDWGGKYQMVLQFETVPQPVDLSLNLSKFGLGKYVHGAINGRTTRQLALDIKSGSNYLGSETVSASGLRTNISLGVFSQGGSISGNAYNGWLAQSLDGQCIQEMVPRLLKRLQELEQLEEANRPRDAEGKVIPQQLRYTLMSVNNEVRPISVTLDKLLDRCSEIAVIKGGHQIGTLAVMYFNADHTNVSVAGDTRLLQKGMTFKAL